MIKRALAYLLIFFSILFLPYWLYIPLIIAISVALPFFWEAVLFGFFIDVLYGEPESFLVLLKSFHALVALVLVIATMVIKERIRFHV